VEKILKRGIDKKLLMAMGRDELSCLIPVGPRLKLLRYQMEQTKHVVG